MPGQSQAALQLLGSASGSGINGEGGDSVSAAANFYFDTTATSHLVIDLFNTTPGGTKDSADVLVGIAFNVNGQGFTLTNGTNSTGFVTPSLTTQAGTSTQLGAGSFAMSYKTAAPPGSPLSALQFGVATNGFGNAFNGAGLNNQNDGIVANGTDITVGGLSNKNPLAMNGLEITLPFLTGNFSAAGVSITNVKFLFGTSGQGIIPGTPTPPVPEPSTLALTLSGGVMGLALLCRKARRARK
jgi:hypothetical protein